MATGTEVFHGSGVALVTPFTKDLTIDYPALERVIKHVTDGGADYLVVHGTTGEPPTTSGAEKQEILEFVKKHNSKQLPIVIGIGGNNTEEVLEIIKQYDYTGVHGILSVGPYYNKPSQEGFYRHFSTIADAAPVPLIVYNVPGRTGANIAAGTIGRLSSHANIAGVKEASGDLIQCMNIVRLSRPGFLLIAGDDLLTLPMISLGGVGAISVLANLYPFEFSEMVRVCRAGDFAKGNELLHRFLDINPLLYEEGNPVGAKRAMQLMGLISEYVRLPLAEASPALTQKIKAVLENQAVSA